MLLISHKNTDFRHCFHSYCYDSIIGDCMQYFLMFSCRLQGLDMFGERVGFLKFKAEIFYKETGKKVSNYIHALLLNLN